MKKADYQVQLLSTVFLLLSSSIFCQEPYELTLHPPFTISRGEKPLTYIGSHGDYQYLLFYDENDGIVTIREFDKDFLPTHRRGLVTHSLGGLKEQYVYSKLVGNKLKVFSRTADMFEHSQKFYLKTLDLETLQITGYGEIANGFLRVLNTQYLQSSVFSEAWDDGQTLSLNYTERVNSKQSKLNAVLFDTLLNPIEEKSIDIPQYYLRMYENHKDYYNPQRYGDIAYSLQSSSKETSLYLVNSTDTTIVEFPIDLDGTRFGDANWWISGDTLMMGGTLKTGHNISSRSLVGFYHGALNITTHETIYSKAAFFDSDFLDSYANAIELEPLEYKNVKNYNGIRTHDGGFVDILDQEDGGWLILAESDFKNDIFMAKYSALGELEWMDFIKSSNIAYKGKAFGEYFDYDDHFYLVLDNQFVLVRNSHVEEFQNLERFKKRKEYSKNYSINLIEVKPDGTMIKQILHDFDGESRYVMYPEYSFAMSNKTALLYSTHEKDLEKVRFMSLSKTE